MDFSILNARPQDIDSLLAIQVECGLSQWSAGAYLAELDREDAIVLVAVRPGDSVVGFICGRAIPGDEEGRPEAEIYNFGVRPANRQNGVGSVLLREFLEECEKRNVYNVWLDVRASNNTAIEFYRSHEFSIAGRRPGFYSLPAEDAEVMVLRLRAADI